MRSASMPPVSHQVKAISLYKVRVVRELALSQEVGG
jgi:hypothetical protein